MQRTCNETHSNVAHKWKVCLQDCTFFKPTPHVINIIMTSCTKKLQSKCSENSATGQKWPGVAALLKHWLKHTRVTLWDDYLRPHFDIVPITMDQQGGGNPKRSLLLFVQQHRPAAGTFEPHHSRQGESIEELAEGHVAAARAGTTLGRRFSRTRQRLGQRRHLLAGHRRKFTVRRHCSTSHVRDSRYPSLISSDLV